MYLGFWFYSRAFHRACADLVGKVLLMGIVFSMQTSSRDSSGRFSCCLTGVLCTTHSTLCDGEGTKVRVQLRLDERLGLVGRQQVRSSLGFDMEAQTKTDDTFASL